LAAVLSAKAFNPLAGACDWSSGPGATVGHVVDRYLRRQLSDIDGLGLRRIGEIEVSLVLAWLIGPDSHVTAAPPPGHAQHPEPGPYADGAAKVHPEAFPGHMKLAEVAAVRVHPRTIIRWADTGKLPCFQTPGGHRRFRAAEVGALLAAAAPVGHHPASNPARRRGSQ